MDEDRTFREELLTGAEEIGSDIAEDIVTLGLGDGNTATPFRESDEE